MCLKTKLFQLYWQQCINLREAEIFILHLNLILIYTPIYLFISGTNLSIM